ncbi:MAG: DNA-directed RNA polymerase subunit omega [Deltaproteobacteria bacterium]|nr:DNA-directed RNA polymerase subunit omega [Deltaproteobacteria bacterium]
MARITVEDCLKKVNNRFALIHMAAKRVRQIRKGVEPTVITKNRDVVTALREIAAGTVFKAEPVHDADLSEKEKGENSPEAREDNTELMPDEEKPEKQKAEQSNG